MKTQKIIALLLTSAMAFSALVLSACRENTLQESSQSDKSSESEDSTQIKFDFSKIEWTASRERDEGSLREVIEFTNNSEYPILNLEIIFEIKPDTTEEDLKAFDKIAETYKIKNVSEIYVAGSYDGLIKQGESNKGKFLINDWIYVQTDEQYSLLEPSEATVEYVDGDKVYEVEYNYLSKKSKEAGDPKPAYEWSKTALGDQIPRLKSKVTSIENDKNTWFKVIGYDYSQSQTDEYVEECKKMGFAVDKVDNYLNSIKLKKDSLKLKVSYDEKSKKITVDLETDDPLESTTQKATQ